MPIPADQLAAIRRLPLLADVPRAISGPLLRDARLQHFGVGSILFREGDAAENLYLPLDARVCLKAGDAPQEHVIEFVPAGEPFILAAVILDKPFLMSAQVVQAGTVLQIPAAEFRRCAARSIALAQAVNESASVQWRALIGQIKSLKLQTGPQRLAAFLASLVEGQSGEATIDLPCERQILATWLGMVPATASRAFKELSRIGVEGRGQKLRIRSVRRLADYAKGT